MERAVGQFRGSGHNCFETAEAGLPDFSWYMIQKLGKIVTNENKTYQMVIKHPKCPYNISSGHKIYQRLSKQKPFKIYPNCDFWFENKPSGNPAAELGSIWNEICI
jgi:hypothetical protein